MVKGRTAALSPCSGVSGTRQWYVSCKVSTCGPHIQPLIPPPCRKQIVGAVAGPHSRTLKSATVIGDSVSNMLYPPMLFQRKSGPRWSERVPVLCKQAEHYSTYEYSTK